MRITKVSVSPTEMYTGDPSLLPTFDNTKLVAVNTCPTWGIVRYTHHKTFATGVGRAMALEAGGAAHEVFAAHRLYHFIEYGSDFYSTNQDTIRDAANKAGARIFGPDRFAEMLNCVDPAEDFRTRCQQFCLTALYNSGFYDDPGDKRRTLTNIEEMCLAYMDRHNWKDKLPFWDGKDFLGIEIGVDVVISITYVDPNKPQMDNYDSELLGKVNGIVFPDRTIDIRFIGKADAVHYTDPSHKQLRIHENKTASRLGEAWEMSWETNHQPTGYMIAISAMLQQSVSEAEILGTCLPLPKAYSINGLARVVARRASWQLKEWFDWLLHTVLLHEQYKTTPLEAPMYTHSCNRYFRPCQFITLCATPPDERQDVFDEMNTQEWNPLHELEAVTDE